MSYFLEIRRLHPPLHQQLYARPYLHRHERRAMGQPRHRRIKSDCCRRVFAVRRSLLLACRCQEPGVYWKQNSGWTGYCPDDCIVPSHYLSLLPGQNNGSRDISMRVDVIISPDCIFCTLSKTPTPYTLPPIHRLVLWSVFNVLMRISLGLWLFAGQACMCTKCLLSLLEFPYDCYLTRYTMLLMWEKSPRKKTCLCSLGVMTRV